jgi:hypothetical protein
MTERTETRISPSFAGFWTIQRERIGEDRNWLAVMAGLTIIELSWWAAVWRMGAAPAPFVGTYLVLTFGGLALAIAARLALRLAPSGAAWPSIVTGTTLVAIGASVFLPLKYAIPSEIPFWLDRPLADVERLIFGGDPWLLLDRLFGWATRPLDWLYGCWLPTQLLIMFFVMLSAPSPRKSRSLIAYSLAWFLLGAIAAVLLSSAGPLFYDRAFGGGTFAHLTETLRNRGAWIALAESDRMWASTSATNPGLIAGISAMPSIHVAISLWIFLTARTMAPRKSRAAFVYFVLIWIGSVQLGWHYASDGLVGALGMLGVWALAGALERTLRSRHMVRLLQPAAPAAL